MKFIRALTLAGVLSLGLSSAAIAQDPQAEDAASSRSATFQAVEGPSTEDVAGVPLLFGAYGTVLALLLGYVLWLGRLQSVSARDVSRLRAALERADEATKRSV